METKSQINTNRIGNSQLNANSRKQLECLEDKAFITASGLILYEELPSDWKEWTEEKLSTFLEDKAWQPFETYDPEVIYGMIEDLAQNLINFSNNN